MHGISGISLSLVVLLAPTLVSGAAAPPQDHAKPAEKATSSNDSHTDALPAGAVLRLGTARFRQEAWIACLAFSPDGKTLASAGGDNSPAFRGLGWSGPGRGSVHLWDPASGTEQRRWQAHPGIVRLLAFSSTGRHLVTAADDGTVRLWETKTGKELHRWPLRVGRQGVAFSPDGRTLAVPGLNNRIALWDIERSREADEYYLGPDGTVGGLCFSHDGKTLAAFYRAHSLIGLWAVAGLRQKQHLDGPEAGFQSLAFSPDGKTLACYSNDHKLRFWDIDSGREARTLDAPKRCLAIHFVPDGTKLALVRDDGAVLVDAASGKELRRIDDQLPPCHALAISPDGKTLAWANGQAIRLQDLSSGRELRHYFGHHKPVEDVAFSPDGKILATVGGRLRLWNAMNGKLLPHGDCDVHATCVAFSPDGGSLLLGCPDQTLRLWDHAAGREVRRFTGEPGVVEFVAFLPGGKTVVSMSPHRYVSQLKGGTQISESQVRLWDVASGREVRQVGGESMHRVALSTDGRRVAMAMNYIHVWDMVTGKKIRQLPGELSLVWSMTFSADGRTLATSAYNQNLRRYELALWDFEFGRLLHRFGENRGLAIRLAISPNGKLLASGGADAVVRLWDVDSAKELRQLRGHRGPVLSLAFSPDGRRLVSGSQDTTALIWDLDAKGP